MEQFATGKNHMPYLRQRNAMIQRAKTVFGPFREPFKKPDGIHLLFGNTVHVQPGEGTIPIL